MSTAKRPKSEVLTEQLIAARAALADATLRLTPQIEAECAKLAQLRSASDRASKACTKAYEVYQTTICDTRDRLFPLETQKQLRAAIQAHVGAKFPRADIKKLARDYAHEQVMQDAVVQTAKAAHDAAHKEADKTRSAYWKADAQGSTLSQLNRELADHKERVAKLEKEIERLPRYREAAKERRADARLKEFVARETGAAREMMKDFNFTEEKARLSG